MDSLLPSLMLLGSVHGLILVLALFFSQFGNRRANRYLAGYIFVFSVALLDFYLDELGHSHSYAWLDTLFWPREFLYGVFIYLFCRELTSPNSPLSRQSQMWLWGPPLVNMLVTWPLLLFPSDLQRSIHTHGMQLDMPWRIWHWIQHDLEVSLSVVHFTVLMLLSIQLLNAHRRQVPENFSYLEEVSLNWQRYLIIGTLGLYIIWAPGELITLLMPQLQLHQSYAITLHVGMVLFIYALGWVGLRQPAIFVKYQDHADATEIKQEDKPENADSNAPLPDNMCKYAHSALSAELAEALVEEARSVMVTEHLYLDSKLSLQTLATHLHVSTNYLSQALNQEAGQNFFDFVNSYRIRHSTKLLDQSSNSIIDVAMDSGFNSKSAFYTAFKKHQGMTPGAFRTNTEHPRSSFPVRQDQN